LSFHDQLEDFSFDMPGQQALDILASDAMKDFREKHGKDIPVLVEGRVGIIKAKADKIAQTYIEKLKEAGATGAIIGGGLVPDEANKSPLESLHQAS
jgi:methylmalonyl-CoA mutase cobalamin-binding subunit